MAKQIRVAFFLFLLMVMFSTVASADGKSMVNVRLTIDGQQKSIQTLARTVGEFLETENIVLTEKDKINISLDEKLNDIMSTVVKLDRAVIINLVIDDGEPAEFLLGPEEKAGHILLEMKEKTGIEYNYGGYLNDEFQAGDTVYLSTIKKVAKEPEPVGEENRVEEFTTLVLVPYATEYVPIHHLPEGETQILTPGVMGETAILTKIVYEGSVIKEKTEQPVVVTEPLNEVVGVGQAMTRPPESYERLLEMEATAYSPEQANLSGHTKMGLEARHGIVAVDPDVIPLGTWLYIDGYGKALAGDTGGSIIGNKIDLCFDTVEECIIFGRRTIQVYVLNQGE